MINDKFTIQYNSKIFIFFVILLFSLSIFIPNSVFGQETKENDRLKIYLSSSTHTNKINEMKQNIPKDVKELTIEDVRKIRASNIDNLILTIQDIQDTNYIKKGKTISSLISDLKDIKQLVLEGGDYGAYVGLTKVKADIISVIEPPAQKNVNKVLDGILTSIKMRNTTMKIPVLIELPLLSPLKQFKQGIPIDQIECKNNLILFEKSISGTPGCFKPSSAQKIIERGWGTKVFTNSAQAMMGN